MMNSTYSKIWENSDKEWKYCKSFYQVILDSLLRYNQFVLGAEEDNTNKSKDYIHLMMRLVKTKVNSEEENSIEDKFKNLKIDIFEKIEEMKKAYSK